MSAIEAVKAVWTVPDVLVAFGLPTPRGRTLKCRLADQHSHGDRFPSATYYAGDDRWWCHRCQQGGDVIDTAALLLHADTSEAIRWLADRRGVSRNEPRNESRRSRPITKHQPPIEQRLRNALDILIGRIHERMPRYTEATAPLLDYVWSALDSLRDLWRAADFYAKPGVEELKRRIRAVDDWITWASSIIAGFTTPEKAKRAIEAADRVEDALKSITPFEDQGYRVIRDA